MKNFYVLIMLIILLSCHSKKNETKLSSNLGGENEDLINMVEKELMNNINDPYTYEFVSFEIDYQILMQTFNDKNKNEISVFHEGAKNAIKNTQVEIESAERQIANFLDDRYSKGNLEKAQYFNKDAKERAKFYLKKMDSIRQANGINGHLPYETVGLIKFRDINENGVKVLKNLTVKINHLTNKVSFL